jgi:membrane associated rhomboid family serine protease
VIPIRDLNPTRSPPVVTYTLIGANVAVWLYQVVIWLSGGDAEMNAFVQRWGVVPYFLTDGESLGALVTPLTSMFMHGDWMHIIGNMWFLWIFGDNVEDALGKVRYLAFYFLGGFAATALQTVITLGYGSQADSEIPNLGASGAVSAVLGAYLIILPRASVVTVIFLLIIFIRELPAWLFLGFWFAFQAVAGGLSIVSPEEGGGVAFFAHIGGFVFGALAVRLFIKRRPLQPAY